MGQSVLRQGVIARLKAATGIFGCLQRDCRKGMREHSATSMLGTEVVTLDDPVDHVDWPRMSNRLFLKERLTLETLRAGTGFAILES